MRVHQPPRKRRLRDWLPYYGWPYLEWLQDFWQHKASGLTLIAANLLPLLGVIFLGWDAFAILLLYWAENVVIGAINVLKIIACNPDRNLLVLGNVDPNDALNRDRMEASRGNSVVELKWANQATKLFDIPFFVVHYGFFCLIHGLVIVAIFHQDSGISSSIHGMLRGLYQVLVDRGLMWAVAALAASHLYSFFAYYIGTGEYRHTTIDRLMFQPYGRVVVLHIAVLLGGFAASVLGNNIAVLTLLIIGKTIMDLSLHLHERGTTTTPVAAASNAPILPDVIPGEALPATATPGRAVQSHPPLRSSSDD